MVGFVASGKEVSAELVADVESFSVGPQQPLHPLHQVWLRRFQDQVKMIAHQTIGVHLALRLAAGLPQS